MSTHDAKELFKHQAATYAAFRPKYPLEFYQKIYDFAGIHQSSVEHRLAVDVGCGSGQVAIELAKTFNQVIACDPSEEQLTHASQAPNITYKVATAEGLSSLIQPLSPQLITVGQAFHWFDIPSFYKEARKILTPSGTLAVFGYAYSTLNSPVGAESDNEEEQYKEANEALRTLGQVTLGPYWDSRRSLVDKHYCGLEPGPEDFKCVESFDMQMTNRMPFSQFLGYLKSWSSYNLYIKQIQDSSQDPIDAFERHIHGIFGIANSDDLIFEIHTPIFGFLAKAPVPL